MGFESLWVAQIYIMCAFLVFTWIPEKWIGTTLGFICASCLIGAVPNTYIGLDEELKEMKWIVMILGIILLLLAFLDVFLLFPHPIQLGLKVENSHLSNKIFLHQYKPSDEAVPVKCFNE